MHSIISSAGLALFVSSALGAPTSSPSSSKGYGVVATDTYDDLGDAANVFVPGATETFITSDGGVVYTNAILSTQAQPLLAGIYAHSEKNYAAYLQTGGATTSAATTGLCYQPKQLFFGCEVMSAENEAAVQVPCTLTLTGHNNKNKRDTGYQSFSFAPQGVTSQLAPALIDPSKLGKSSVVHFQTTVSALDLTSALSTLGVASTASATVVTFFDDFSYIQYDLNDVGSCGSSYKSS